MLLKWVDVHGVALDKSSCLDNRWQQHSQSNSCTNQGPGGFSLLIEKRCGLLSSCLPLAASLPDRCLGLDGHLMLPEALHQHV